MADTTTPSIVCLTADGAVIARRLGFELHGLRGRVDGADITFDDTIEHLAELFIAGRPIIGICSAAILIRAVAPFLANKWEEPPVVAVSEDGAHVVPLLGGHRGANRLARHIAATLGVTAAITTAGDTRFDIALDEPPRGWRLAEPGQAKAAMATILAKGGAEVVGDLPWLASLPQVTGVRIEATTHPLAGSECHIVLHPQCLTLGVGCSRGCPPEELLALARETLAAADVAPGALAAIATVDLKADEPAVIELARTLDTPLRLFTADELETLTPRLATPSEVVFQEIGCHGVAEAAALATAGGDAVLELAKRKSAMATCAVGRAAHPITEPCGRKPGSVRLVGIGPGKALWRTPEASRLVASADLLVGYGLYLDLLGPLARGKAQARFPLGQETERCRHALEQAGLGLDVALICSGDAGIYAMAALVMELLDRDPDLSDAARRVEVTTTPGVSAAQAAAARVGAPLGHDFCTISLSDLMTPWSVIEQRIEAAARGDFVTVFYNPVSMRRRTQLSRAREILLAHRPSVTPVVIAASLGRDDEKLQILTLDELSVDQVDMLSTVIIGSTTTRILERGRGPMVYTPRGYADREQRCAS